VAPQQRGKESLLVQVRAAAQHSTCTWPGRSRGIVGWRGAAVSSCVAVAALLSSPPSDVHACHMQLPQIYRQQLHRHKTSTVAPGLHC
jgi:hypothetical protein